MSRPERGIVLGRFSRRQYVLLVLLVNKEGEEDDVEFASAGENERVSHCGT